MIGRSNFSDNALTPNANNDDIFAGAQLEWAGPVHFRVTGVFRAYRGKWHMDIEMPMTVKQDGSDYRDVVSEMTSELIEKPYHGYTDALFRYLTRA